MLREPSASEITYMMNMVERLFDEDFYEKVVVYGGSTCCWECMERTFRDWTYEHEDLANEYGLEFHSGVTKICIIPMEFDWVVKIGRVERDHENDTNYCAMEADYFQKAIDNHVADAFAATYEIGEVRGVPIFAQEWVEVNEDGNSNRMYDYMSSITPIYDDEDPDRYNDRISDEVDYMTDEDRIYAMLGEDRGDVVDFVLTFDIDDLHQGNWGVNRDGKCVMIEFSGYN